MTNHETEAAVVAEITRQAAGPVEVYPGVFALPDASGALRLVELDPYGDAPRHVTAARTVRDAASFVAYIEKHGLDQSEVWADTVTSKVVAVIDAHQGAERAAGWGKHTLTLALETTEAWKQWAKIDGQLLDQATFADFIEGRAVDVVKPDSATFLELAQSFQAKRNVDFESGHRLDSGQTRLEYKEEIKAKAGQKGNIDIPNEVELALKPYVGGPAYKVRARFRYRITEAGLALGVALLRPADILEAAFTDIVTDIREGKKNPDAQTSDDEWIHGGITQPIFYGRP